MRILIAVAATASILAVIASLLLGSDGDEDVVTVAAVTPPLGVASSAATDPAAPPSERASSADESRVPASEESPSSAGSGSPVVRVRGGESVEIFDSPDGDLVATQTDQTEFGSPSVFSVRRDRGGWLGISTHLMPNGELGWIRAEARSLKSGYLYHSVVVDLSDRLATTFYDDKQVRSWPITVGAMGTETPTGRFAVTDTFRDGLNPAYGCCAVALSATQPNLPSGWLAGDRIAFHGTAGPLGVAASSGCIRSADRDVDALLETVPLGTPVTIRE